MAKQIGFDDQAPAPTLDPDDYVPAADELGEDAGGTMQVEASQASELGYGAPEQEDLRLPRIRLAQGLTPEVMDGKAKAGDWLLPTGEVLQELEVQLLGMKKSRQRRLNQEQNRELVCSSADAVFGVGDPGIECAKCPFSEWTGEKPNRKPPECTKFYDYLVQYVVNGAQGVATLSLSEKSAQNVAGNFNTYLRAHGSGVYVLLKSEQIVKGNRRYCVPKLAGVRPANAGPAIGATVAAG